MSRVNANGETVEEVLQSIHRLSIKQAFNIDPAAVRSQRNLAFAIRHSPFAFERIVRLIDLGMTTTTVVLFCCRPRLPLLAQRRNLLFGWTRHGKEHAVLPLNE